MIENNKKKNYLGVFFIHIREHVSILKLDVDALYKNKTQINQRVRKSKTLKNNKHEIVYGMLPI